MRLPSLYPSLVSLLKAVQSGGGGVVLPAIRGPAVGLPLWGASSLSKRLCECLGRLGETQAGRLAVGVLLLPAGTIVSFLF